MFGSRIRAFVPSLVIISMQRIEPSGAPALTAASWSISAAAFEQFTAFGCGAKTIVSLALIAISALYITVDVGFVTGVIPISVPMGSAISYIFRSGNSLINPTVFISLIH